MQSAGSVLSFIASLSLKEEGDIRGYVPLTEAVEDDKEVGHVADLSHYDPLEDVFGTDAGQTCVLNRIAISARSTRCGRAYDGCIRTSCSA
jgi:hypothetical protein